MMSIDPSKFLTSTLSQAPVGPSICRILAAAIDAVDPYTAVTKYFKRDGNLLICDQQTINLDDVNRTIVIGIGKACLPMSLAVYDQLSTYFTQGVVLTKDGYGNLPDGYAIPPELLIVEAGHPLPDSRGISGTQNIIDLLHTTNEQDLIIFLISGGGSALLTSPANGISIEDLQKLTSALLSCGATIQEINYIRKHLDTVKGGQLARIAYPSRVISLILSDVIGDSLDIIASGPLVPDPSTYHDAISILNKYDQLKSIPTAVESFLEKGMAGLLPDTPKFNDPVFKNIHNTIVGNNHQAATAAFIQARTEGFNPLILTNYLQGEARHVGTVVASIALQLALKNQPVSRPACLVLGGETTVTLTGKGVGGRNQELVMGCVEPLAGIERTIVVSLATDGGDGPTDAAGAVVTGDTNRNARILGLSPNQYLQHNNSYNFFNTLSDLIKTGPTKTNVNDLVFIFTY